MEKEKEMLNITMNNIITERYFKRGAGMERICTLAALAAACIIWDVSFASLVPLQGEGELERLQEMMLRKKSMAQQQE